MSKIAPKHIRTTAIIGLWLAVLGFGFGKLFLYSNTAGTSAKATPRWPEASSLARDPNLSTLVIFAHPHCPCSAATVGELERLMPHINGKTKNIVVFVKPKSQQESWAKDGLWKKVQSIPGVESMLDEDGVVAAHFDAQTSGQTFLFNKEGSLVFRGGITSARGHRGDSDGRRAILSFFESGDAIVSSTSVFGCSLRNPERTLAGEKP